jgi:hypothetical protein
MKTAEETLTHWGLSYYDTNNEGVWKFIIEIMKDYAYEAINEDRKNLIKYADVDISFKNDSTLCRVKADSVINAPQIELK